MNASRIVGPAIGSVIFVRFGASWVFLVNAASFAAIVATILRVPLPEPPSTGAQGLHRLLEGVRVARTDRVVGQCLATIFTFSFLSLPFITQMPEIAAVNLGIEARSGMRRALRLLRPGCRGGCTVHRNCVCRFVDGSGYPLWPHRLRRDVGDVRIPAQSRLQRSR